MNGCKVSHALNTRIRRTLSQLAALGLIVQVTLPKINEETGGREYLKAFRPLRETDFSRLSDLESIKRALNPQTEEQFYFLVHLDYETSDRAGAGGMFQVISIEDDEGKDFTHLVDQGFHYASLDELGRTSLKPSRYLPITLSWRKCNAPALPAFTELSADFGHKSSLCKRLSFGP